MFWMYMSFIGCAKPVEKQVVPTQEVLSEVTDQVPQATDGVTSVQTLGFIDIRNEFSEQKEPLYFRLRQLEIAPQGTVGFHAHRHRPGVAYIVKGAITEYRGKKELVRSQGDFSFEHNGVQHGWRNHTQEPVQAIVVDVWSPQEAPFPSIDALPVQKELADAPKENSGIALVHKEVSSLDDLFADKSLRIRVVDVEERGVVGAHTHVSRPSFAYVLSGDVMEHRGDGDYTHIAGSSVAERHGLTHWWENTGTGVAKIVVVDIIDAD